MALSRPLRLFRTYAIMALFPLTFFLNVNPSFSRTPFTISTEHQSSIDQSSLLYRIFLQGVLAETHGNYDGFILTEPRPTQIFRTLSEEISRTESPQLKNIFSQLGAEMWALSRLPSMADFTEGQHLENDQVLQSYFQTLTTKASSIDIDNIPSASPEQAAMVSRMWPKTFSSVAAFVQLQKRALYNSPLLTEKLVPKTMDRSL